MIVYDGTNTEFLESVINDTIAQEVEKRIQERMGRKTGTAEFRSWENSMQHMFKVLSDTSIPNDAGIAIEYNIPQTSKRVDFIITGYDDTEKPNAVIIELKQWDQITEIEGPDALVETYTGGALRRVVHPSYECCRFFEQNEIHQTSKRSSRAGSFFLFNCV